MEIVLNANKYKAVMDLKVLLEMKKAKLDLNLTTK